MSSTVSAIDIVATRTKSDAPAGEVGFVEDFRALSKLWVGVAAQAGLDATVVALAEDIFPSGRFAVVRVGGLPYILRTDGFFIGDVQEIVARNPVNDEELSQFRLAF